MSPTTSRPQRAGEAHFAIAGQPPLALEPPDRDCGRTDSLLAVCDVISAVTSTRGRGRRGLRSSSLADGLREMLQTSVARLSPGPTPLETASSREVPAEVPIPAHRRASFSVRGPSRAFQEGERDEAWLALFAPGARLPCCRSCRTAPWHHNRRLGRLTEAPLAWTRGSNAARGTSPAPWTGPNTARLARFPTSSEMGCGNASRGRRANATAQICQLPSSCTGPRGDGSAARTRSRGRPSSRLRPG